MSVAIFLRKTPRSLSLCLLALTLAACQTVKPHRAPVEDRSTVPPAPSAPATEPKPAPAPAEPVKAGHYAVKPGDTLIRIALDHGISWRDLARWNGLDNPNLIEVGQLLRVQPPTAPMVPTGNETKPVQSARIESRPLDAKPGSPAASAPVTQAPAPVAAATPAVETEPAWAWPANGGVIAGFDEQRNKGLGLAGKAGDPVLAAADGRVMYAGSGLRGYGNMVIIKHNETYLSAYAHNQTLLVKEDQVVKKGQPIAEMGSSDTDQVKLHFEIRRKGKPVDPARLLPPR